MSKSLGGVEVEVSQMRRTLIDEAFKNNIKESDLGYLVKKILLRWKILLIKKMIY